MKAAQAVRRGEQDLFWNETIILIADDWWNLSKTPSPHGKILSARGAGLHGFSPDAAKIHPLNEVWLYDAEGARYRARVFRNDDIAAMNMCGISFASNFLSDKKSAKNSRRKLSVRINKTVQEKSSENLLHLSEQKKQDYFEAAKNFYIKRYCIKKYEWKQPLLWTDLKKDYETIFKKFFDGCEDRYIQMFLRRIANIIGHELGNVSGD